MNVSETVYLILKWTQLSFSVFKLVLELFVDLMPWYRRENGNLATLIIYRLLPYAIELILVIGTLASTFWLFLNPLLLAKEFVTRWKVPNIVVEAIFGTRDNRSSTALLVTTLLILVVVCAVIAMLIFVFGHNDISDDSGVCETYW